MKGTKILQKLIVSIFQIIFKTNIQNVFFTLFMQLITNKRFESYFRLIFFPNLSSASRLPVPKPNHFAEFSVLSQISLGTCIEVR